MNPSRGLIVVGALSVAFGILVSGVIAWMIIQLVGGGLTDRAPDALRNLSIFGAAFGLAPIGLGAALLAMRTWSRTLMMVYKTGVIIAIAASYMAATRSGYGGASWSAMLIPLAWCAAVIAYLRRPSVRQSFQS